MCGLSLASYFFALKGSSNFLARVMHDGNNLLLRFNMEINTQIFQIIEFKLISDNKK